MNKTQEEHLCRDIHKIALALEKIAKALPSAEQEAPDINVGNMDTTTHDSIPAETGKNDGDKTSGDCISRQQAIDALCSVCNALGGGHNCDKTKFVYNAPFDEQVILCPEHYALTMLPSAQPDIIRCKDCEWWTKQENSIQGRCALHKRYPSGNWYCGTARRRGEQNDNR